tara:strand:+ start:2464 stop:2634 length:171 start_codon:yes stop_codon:yes gene_type:complete
MNAFEKVKKVIDSCITKPHFNGAMVYLLLFKKFGTDNQYEYLLTYLHNRLDKQYGD